MITKMETHERRSFALINIRGERKKNSSQTQYMVESILPVSKFQYKSDDDFEIRSDTILYSESQMVTSISNVLTRPSGIVLPRRKPSVKGASCRQSRHASASHATSSSMLGSPAMQRLSASPCAEQAAGCVALAAGRPPCGIERPMRPTIPTFKLLAEADH